MDKLRKFNRDKWRDIIERVVVRERPPFTIKKYGSGGGVSSGKVRGVDPHRADQKLRKF